MELVRCSLSIVCDWQEVGRRLALRTTWFGIRIVLDSVTFSASQTDVPMFLPPTRYRSGDLWPESGVSLGEEMRAW